MFHTLVDKVYVINLRSSTDRKRLITYQCSRVGTQFELVEAVDGRAEDVAWNENGSSSDGWTQGAAGLAYTTRHIIRDAKENDYERVMIMEDDILFKDNAYQQAEVLFHQLPRNWELFHLASQSYNRPQRVGDLLRLAGAWSCQIYMVHRRIFDEYLLWLSLVDRPIDCITSKVFHPRGNSYAPVVDLVVTMPNYSTIRGTEMDYGKKSRLSARPGDP